MTSLPPGQEAVFRAIEQQAAINRIQGDHLDDPATDEELAYLVACGAIAPEGRVLVEGRELWRLFQAYRQRHRSTSQ